MRMTLQTFLKLTPNAKNFETIAKYKFDTLFIHTDQVDTLGNSVTVLLQKLNFFFFTLLNDGIQGSFHQAVFLLQ